jgi:RNA-directed DNA polymerase
MDFIEYTQKFTAKAQVASYSAETIERCLSYAKILIDSELPVIYNYSHLAALVGYNTTYILRAADHPRYFYRQFNIQKKSNGVRVISEPLPSLMEIQQWLLHELLYYVDVSKFSKAYLPNTTLKQNLVFHRNTSLVMKLDIENFGSIKRNSIRKIFISLGYSLPLSNLFSKLCCLDDQLPQGAPTSPYLSNLYLKKFDEKVGAFCLPHKIRYTRYADDLTFSGDFNTEIIHDFVKNELEKLNLFLNSGKTSVMKKSDRQIVTGVVVNEKLQVERSKRKKIRQIMHFIDNFGLENHMNRIGCYRDNYLGHLLGKINFILFINPDDTEFLAYKKKLLKLQNG